MRQALIIMFLSLGIGIFIGLGLAAQQDKKIQIVPPRAFTLGIPAGSEVHFYQNDQYGTEVIIDTPTSVQVPESYGTSFQHHVHYSRNHQDQPDPAPNAPPPTAEFVLVLLVLAVFVGWALWSLGSRR